MTDRERRERGRREHARGEHARGEHARGERARGVLVVDDDASIQGFLAEALVDEGYEVRTAADGRQALGVLASWRPRLILLDLMMPEMDGWTFRAEQRTRADVAHIPVIVLSATRDLEAHTAALAPARVFSKPFDLDALLTAIDELVPSHASDRASQAPPRPS